MSEEVAKTKRILDQSWKNFHQPSSWENAQNQIDSLLIKLLDFCNKNSKTHGFLPNISHIIKEIKIHVQNQVSEGEVICSQLQMVTIACVLATSIIVLEIEQEAIPGQADGTHSTSALKLQYIENFEKFKEFGHQLLEKLGKVSYMFSNLNNGTNLRSFEYSLKLINIKMNNFCQLFGLLVLQTIEIQTVQDGQESNFLSGDSCNWKNMVKVMGVSAALGTLTVISSNLPMPIPSGSQVAVGLSAIVATAKLLKSNSKTSQTNAVITTDKGYVFQPQQSQSIKEEFKYFNQMMETLGKVQIQAATFETESPQRVFGHVQCLTQLLTSAGLIIGSNNI